MKNLLFTCLFLGAFCSLVNAQSVVHLTPLPASAFGTIDDIDVAVDAEITNLTSNTLHMKWERQVIEITPGCETAVCDCNLCWARFVSTKPFEMDPNETCQLLVHYYNNGAACAGIVHIKVTNLDNLADTTIGVYLFNQMTGTKDLPLANVKLFPNPTTEYFSLENAENVAVIKIFALDGREAARFDASTKNYYSLQSLTAGNYVLALEDKNGQAFQAMALTKQ